VAQSFHNILFTPPDYETHSSVTRHLFPYILSELQDRKTKKYIFKYEGKSGYEKVLPER
jgi:hypothetical protein